MTTATSDRTAVADAAALAARHESLACLLSSSQIRRRRSRAVRILITIACVLLVAELLVFVTRVVQQDDWSSSWVLAVVFPSHNVTCAKVLCLACGFALTFYHLQQHAIEHELPQIKLMNEYQRPGIISSSSSDTAVAVHVNGKEPIAFENEFFQGHLLFLVRDSTLPSNSSNRRKSATKSNWSHLFNGRKRALWVQVQGRFKRVPPPDTTLFLAVEVASPLKLGYWTRKLVEVLVTIMKKIAKHVHVSFGDDVNGAGGDGDECELPHAAFPLYQSVDEFVETPIVNDDGDGSSATTMVKLPPMLGIENLGETQQQKELRQRSPSSSSSSGSSGDSGEKKTFALDRVYTFQFYTMYADLAQWQIANLPGMPEIPLKKLTGEQPIRFSAYTVKTVVASDATSPTSPSNRTSSTAGAAPRHTRAAKDYIFCFSLQYNEDNKRPAGSSTSAMATSSTTSSSSSDTSGSSDRSSVLYSPTASSLRSTLQSPLIASGTATPSELSSSLSSESLAHTATAAAAALPALPPKLEQHEQALRNLRFALPMWVEQVDRVAGNRKVSYLFTVEETVRAQNQGARSTHHGIMTHRYSVVRSAATIKNALLMLRDDDDDDRAAKEAANDATKFNRSHEEEFRKLLVESREFLYDTITSETEALEAALHKIATDNIIASSSASSTTTMTKLEKLKRAMLCHCLKSSGTLASVRAFTDIGIQLSKAKRERMDIIWERGVYRTHTPRLLRQEWLMLTTSDVLFFRSYSMRACKTVAITELLRVQAVDAPHVLNPQPSPSDADASKEGWHCVELHLVCEVVTLFLESEDAAKQFAASLNQMLRLIAKPGRLPAPRTFENQPLPLCLNQRNMLSTCSPATVSLGVETPSSLPAQSARCSPLALIQDTLRKGLAVYEMPLSERKASDLLPFLDAVELLSDMELPHEDDDACVVLGTGLHSGGSRAPSAAAVLPFTHEEKLAFALNLYHVLFIHATLVFGAPTSHFQWKKLQSVPYYVIGKHRSHHKQHKQVRLTLEVIEHEMLRAGGGALPPSAGASVLSPGASGARRLLLLGSSRNSNASSSSSGGGDLSVPKHLAISRADFRTTFALQMNCKPGTSVVRVYDGSERIHEQLNTTCSLFLARELRVDVFERVIQLPRVVEWRQQDFLPRSGKSVAIMGGGRADDPRAFYCLQKLLGFLEEHQRDQVTNVLLGAGKSARIVYDSFWTQSSSSNSNSSGGSSSGGSNSSGSSAGVLKRRTSSQGGASPDSNASSGRSKSDAVAVAAVAPSSTHSRVGGALQFIQSFF